MKKNNCFIWISDCYSNTGEGRLGISFIKRLSYHKKIRLEVKSPEIYCQNLIEFNKKIKNLNFKKSNSSFFYRYTIFLRGLFNLWIHYFKGKRVLYLNYLPLWNFLIFLLCPPNTIFGPITGLNRYDSKTLSLDYIIRKFLFPTFFSISVFILKFRSNKYFFSTSLLKNNITKKIHHRSLFDVQLLFLKKNKLNFKKKYDLIFYNRNHSNKFYYNYLDILNNDRFNKFKILSLGEKIKKKNVKNLGFVTNNNLINYLKKTKFALIPDENLYSFFLFDVIFSGSIPLVSKKEINRNKFLRINKELYIDYKNSYLPIDQIIKNLKSKKKYKIKINFGKIRLISKKFDQYLLELFKSN
jgi:hypothetical protein